MEPIAPGNLLDGKYEIVGLLGAGGMGEVYKVRHIHLNAFRCIKIMKPNLLADDSYRQRFLREARLATQIHHPNIAVVHDFELLDEGASYMVTEFIDGTTLRQWSADNGRFPLPLAAEITVQVLAGLDAIHRRGLLHRDISADNIMMSFDGDDCLQVKIIDLGVAKDVSSAADTTQAGMLIGNPKYMSPEQLGELEEGEQLDARADLYCLGVVLYEMLTGVPPFVARTPNGYIVKKLTEAAPPFRTVQPDLTWPDGLEAVVLRALERDRRKRYPDARAFSRAIEPFLTRATGTYTRTEVERLRKPVDRTLATPIPTEVVRSDSRPITAEVAFQLAWENGSTTAWRRFLDAHADTPEGVRARALLNEAAEFERAVKEGTDTALREFLKRWPEGRHRLEAQIRLVEVKRRIEETAWQEALAADTFAAMRDYAMHYPSAAHLEEAQRRMPERLAFETAAALDSEAGWDEYVARWDDDPHAGVGRERRALARRREEEAFFAAVEAKTVAAWEEFLRRFPGARRAARAEIHRREAIAFDEACHKGVDALERFVTMFPDGLLTNEARRILKRDAEERDIELARANDTASAWQRYLALHPAGSWQEEARRRLTELEDAAFAAMLASKNVESATRFVATFPDSARLQEAEKLAVMWGETAAVQQALEAIARGDGEAAVPLLARVSDPESRAEIQTALSAWRRAVAAEREPRDWDAAWEVGTTAAWDDYLAQHASSDRAAEARRCRQEAAEFEAALATNTATLWRAFVKAWPEGRHRLDAELRLRVISRN